MREKKNWHIFRRFVPPEGADLIKARKLAERDGRGTIFEAMLILKEEAGEFFNIENAVRNGEIPSYAPGSCKPLGSPQKNLTAALEEEEVYAVELNAWLNAKYPRVKFRFPKVGAGGTASEEEDCDVAIANDSKKANEPPAVTADVVKDAFPTIDWGDSLSKVSETKYQWLNSAVRYKGSPRPGDAKRFSLAQVASCLMLGPKKLHRNTAAAIIKKHPEWLPEWERLSEYLPKN